MNSSQIVHRLAIMAAVSFPSLGVAQHQFAWQTPNATVLETGDLRWAPEPFKLEVGQSIRYIDFEAGNDDNDGASKDKPWKHHPWDKNAAGKSAASSGVDTFIFKCGVAYRGVIGVKSSGTAATPIRLTSDPGWGSGEAMVYASERVTGQWQKATTATAPGFPEPQKIWYVDLGKVARPYSLWEVRDGKVIRIPIARDPNWTVSNPDDVKSEWYVWQTTRQEKVGQAPATGRRGGAEERTWATDAMHLTATDAKAYEGGTVWTEYVSVMGQPYAAPIEAFDPEKKAIKLGGPWGSSAGTYHPIINCRYFLENLPRFLDSAGEYYFQGTGANAGRLYVRLADDRDPNTARIEVPRQVTSIDIRNQGHIQISGLTFRFGNIANLQERWWVIPEADTAMVRILGNCDGIRVSNCSFEYVPLSIRAKAQGPDSAIDHLSITDNRFEFTDQEAINVGQGGGGDKLQGALRTVEVLRNYMHEIGHRPYRAGQAPTLCVEYPRFANIAGNILDRTYGAGVFVHGGKGGGSSYDVPVTRILIHHNRVTDPLLTVNDYGGIETWQGGPFYVFNNISGNPGGYWNFSSAGRKDAAQRTHTSARFGFAYYLDGSFKNYLFNNIAWGKSNDLSSPLANTAALQEIIGFDNVFANNTFYNFAAGARRQAPQAGRDAYLGNIWQDMSELYFRHADIDRSQDVNLERAMADKDHAYDTVAYVNNIFSGQPRVFGSFQSHGPIHKTANDFESALQKENAKGSQLGEVAAKPPLPNADKHDFRPAPDSPVIGRGVKQFIPWGLYATVGEWSFHRNPEDPNVIRDASWYMTAQYANRESYRRTARYDLAGHGLTVESYTNGPLEDWVAGALKLDGKTQFLSLSDAELKKDIPSLRSNSTIPGSERQTVDMGTNSFLIEAYFRTQGPEGGVIVSKFVGNSGYALCINKDGMPGLILGTGQEIAASFDGSVSNGNWHHCIAEVDRPAAMIRLYVDGKLLQQSPLRAATGASLSNTADFLVGRKPQTLNVSTPEFFAGEIEFLRVCRGTLKDANTTIEELYAWEFDGPQFRDFTGRKPEGPKRDAGALQASR